MGLGLTNLNDKDPQRGFSASNAVAVTPSDTANNFLDYNAEYLWIGGAGSGNLTVITTSGQTVTFAFPTGVTSLEEWGAILANAYSQLDDNASVSTDRTVARFRNC